MTTIVTSAVDLVPAVYVACEAAGQEGFDVGTWISVTVESPADIRRDVERLLSQCPGSHEHRLVVTKTFDFMKCEMSRYEALKKYVIVGRGLARFGQPFSAYVRHVGVAGVHGGLEDEFQRVYLGEFPDSDAAVGEVMDLLEDSEALYVTNRSDEGATYAFLNRDRLPLGPVWDVWENETS